ncbi:MAG: NirD/YgiW/YdeI family stress tolerance protein [Sulfurospirillum sp.]|nr:NirD/YgiW/YdeI family stress tolerance protein [Sulfurospirillum sp.]MBL0703179.1 NirD/YgiW/YdeI family stress tolerance protein [Sulfurospirillum sp.]
MNKIISLLFFIVLFSTAALAGFSGKGSTGSMITTVEDIKTMRDDSKVVLVGHLVKQLSYEYYMFKDATGQIEIEIDEDIFTGRDITSSNKIKIFGEVDKDWNRITIDVDYFDILK